MPQPSKQLSREKAEILPPTECQAFFDLHRSNSERCVELQKKDESTQILWESQKASRISPGVVERDEILCRHWLNPIHWDAATNELKPTAISDISRLGFSVNRLAYIDLDGVKEKAEERVLEHNEKFKDDLGGQRSLVGYSNFQVAQVRALFAGTPARRAIGVYDTATEENPEKKIRKDISHADVCQLISDKKEARRIRNDMWRIMNASFRRFEEVA